MLTPEYLQEITDKSESLAAGLKEYIIKRIVRSIMVRLQRGEEFKLSQDRKSTRLNSSHP